MRFCEMHQKDVTAIFAVRTSTHENRMTMEELKDRSVKPESVTQILEKDAKGWICEQGDEILGFTMGDGRSGEMLVLTVLPKAEGQGSVGP